jgi:RNA polymerase sigma-70 factor (ECF subfamily)
MVAVLDRSLMDHLSASKSAAEEEASAEAPSAEAPPVRTRDLVARARTGDEGAFEELFNRHKRRVSLIAGRFFSRREQVEEIIQDTFTKVYFALDSYANSETDDDALFAAWIARIAFNTCYDELRRMKRRPESTVSDLTQEETGWLENRMRADATTNAESETITRDLARKLLARLSPEDRLVLTLLNAEELSVVEISKLMNWSVSKVKVRAHRARAALRRSLRKLL